MSNLNNRDAFDTTARNMRIGAVFFAVTMLGLLTLAVGFVIASATSGVSLNSLLSRTMGENFSLLVGHAIIPFIIGGVLSGVGFLGFAGSIIANFFVK